MIEIDVIRRRPDDPEPVKAVAHREWNDPADHRVPGELLRRFQRDVSGRNIEVEDAGENELDRAALGTDDEIDHLRVATESFADLSVDNHHEADGADTEGEQQNVEQRPERPRSQIAPRKLQ